MQNYKEHKLNNVSILGWLQQAQMFMKNISKEIRMITSKYDGGYTLILGPHITIYTITKGGG